MKPRFGTVQRVGAGAQLLDKRGSSNDGFKNSVKEGAILFQPKAGCPDGCFYPPTLLSNVEPRAVQNAAPETAAQ